MGLSSNILWQQTDRKGLIGILRSRMLKYGYSKEQVFKDAKHYTLAIPMVSTCDLPFSELGPYLGKYGEYTIGFSREWGYRNKLNSVWYCRRNSEVYAFLKNAIDKVITGQQNDTLNIAYNILCYIKFEEDELVQRNYSKYRFIDEREFRLCPSIDALLNKNVPVFLDEYAYAKYKNEHDKSSLLDFGVSFDWKDIKYIIIKSGTKVESIQKILEEENCTNSQIAIFTEDQVKEDFIGIDHNKILEQEKNGAEHQIPLDIWKLFEFMSKK